MELNSVRELKAALAAKVVPAAAESAMMRGPARALFLAMASPPAIALGVAPKAGGGYARAVGLLFAGGDQGGANGQGLTCANPIREVLDALKVDLVF